MIAIPVDSIKPDVKSSALFGNVNYFALYNPQGKEFRFIKNDGYGDGIKTAELLKEHNASKVFYSYMGKGPFSHLQESGIEVYYLGPEPLDLDDIVSSYDEEGFIQVTHDNAETFLDPGTHTGECQCG